MAALLLLQPNVGRGVGVDRAFPHRLRLKPGVDPQHAVCVLSERIIMGANVTAHGVGPGGPDTTSALRNAYLEWAEATESQLSGLTLDGDVITALQTPRYWRVRALHDDPRPFRLVDAEVRQQVAWLQALLDDLKSRLAKISARHGHLTVLDTNILLHYLPPAQVPWADVVGRSPVRLVLPLRVVEELDAKKYARRDELSARARGVLPQVESIVSADGAPGRLSADTTLEVFIEPGVRHRPLDADEEILEVCQELRQLSGQQVTLVTGDTAMRLRATAHAISVVPMPEAYSRRAQADRE
jgi:hypothetical protein